jgi:hypothetical protein
MLVNDALEATWPGTTTLIGELCRAKAGRPRQKIIGVLVTELANRMWAPEGVPARIAVALPPAAKLRRAASRLDPVSWYRLEVADGRSIVAAGFDLVAVRAGLARLSDAQRAGDESAARRALQDLCGPPGH